jgi:uncharacterized protein YdbL (DUF1318 family)
MRRTGHRIGIATLLVFALLAVPSGGVLAEPLADAKKAGSVGERPDGYLGLVGNDAGAEVKALVQDINGKRREKYGAIAKKNGTSVTAVAALAGAKLVEKARPGEYVMTSSGKWVRKTAR